MPQTTLTQRMKRQFQIKLSADEFERYLEIGKKVELRGEANKYLDVSVVNRILLGLDPPNSKLVSDQDVELFRGAVKTSKKPTAPMQKGGSLHNKPKRPTGKRVVNGD